MLGDIRIHSRTLTLSFILARITSNALIPILKALTLSEKKNLGTISTKQFDDYLIIPLSKEWLCLNNEKPIVFDIELTKEGKLVLSSLLSELDRTKDVVTNVL